VKILRVVTRLNVGGPSRQIQELINEIPIEIASQTLLVGNCSLNEKEYHLENRLGIKIIKSKSLSRQVSFVRDFRAFFHIRKCILQESPDIIHTHMSKAWFLTALACVTMRQSPILVHTFHGHTFHSYFKGIGNTLNKYAQKFCASKSDLLISVDEKIRLQVLRERVGEPDRFVTISPGFRIPKIHDRQIARKTLGLEENKFLIGYIGRLEPIKRPDLLMEIIAKMSEMSTEVSFVVAGGGSLENLFAQAKESLSLSYLGWVVDVGMFYSAMDLLVLTSDNEGTPLTIIEAGMTGIPTISRAIGGVTSLIQNEETGFLVGDDPLSFTSCIEKVLNSPELLKTISQNCRISFQENFQSEKFVTNHLNVYQELLRANR
jgi:glycosyltransferase involved in cell wall biosynthesis